MTAFDSAGRTEPPPGALRWLREQLGEFRVVRACRQDSRRTGVWELTCAGGRHYLKLNRRRVRWGTELFVYRNWIDAFRPYAPDLEGVLEVDGLHGLLLSAVKGVPLREAGLPPERQDRAYAKAGELIARLHALDTGSWFGVMDELGSPVGDVGGRLDDEPTDPVLRYRAAIEASLSKAEAAGAVDDDETRIARDVLDSLRGLTFDAPVPTSFDYTPGNWVVDERGELTGVIDFENMAWGLREDPFVRLLVDYFPQSRRLEDAFCDGYGRRPFEQHPERVRIGLLLYALLYKTEAVELKRPELAGRGERAFGLCSG
ncbi:MAG TPA: aminoglycoside phosphotransferase family protein [Phycisphaerae bacterium]|nr:aminoglycoside phosphotransferase family protein [Phycisphaerae bacterium]